MIYCGHICTDIITTVQVPPSTAVPIESSSVITEVTTAAGEYNV